MLVLYAILIIAFAYIHLFESIVFPLRISSIQQGLVASGYSYSQIIATGTRFLMLFFMPALGFIVDKNIEPELYLVIVSLSLFCAALLTAGVFFGKEAIALSMQGKFCGILYFLRSLISIIFSLKIKNKNIRFALNSRLMWMSVMVYSFYSTSVFFSFFFALIYHDYRVTIALMSGVTNGFATVILTFLIEPLIARKIDSQSSDSTDAINSIFLGRLISILLVSQILVFTLYLLML